MVYPLYHWFKDNQKRLETGKAVILSSMLKFCFILAVLSGSSPAVYSHPSRQVRNNGIHLAVEPRCGTLDGETFDINAGIYPERFQTIVSFGVRVAFSMFSLYWYWWIQQDSYTDGGKSDGSTLDPPILNPPSSQAGGRSTNGLTWIEHVANDIGATLKDYAVSCVSCLKKLTVLIWTNQQSAACIDLTLWPSNPRQADFIGQGFFFAFGIQYLYILINHQHQLTPSYAREII